MQAHKHGDLSTMPAANLKSGRVQTMNEGNDEQGKNNSSPEEMNDFNEMEALLEEHQDLPPRHEAFDHLFLAGFFGAGGACAAVVRSGCSAWSAIFATVMIWICWLTGAVGCAASSSCSSPSPTDCKRFDEILKVLTNTSRIASALLWLRSALLSRFPFASMWPTIRNP